MTLLEWYFDNATSGLAQTTILPVTQWKYKFVSGAAVAAGTSTTVTETKLAFIDPLVSGTGASLDSQTTTTTTSNTSQQYPAGSPSTYYYPLVNNRLEEMTGYIQNAAGVSGNYIVFAIEVELDGDFDE